VTTNLAHPGPLHEPQAEAGPASQSELPEPLQQLQAEVDDFMQELFTDYTPRRIRHGKMFRVAVSDYLWFAPYECVVIDTPLLQRLRYIHQTALAYQVYPSARHTRFEHSLGVAALAGRMMEALQRQHRQIVSQVDVDEVRLAGLLHDIGHSMFSHLSESIMMEHFEVTMSRIRRSRFFANRKIKIGEVLSFLMVRSPVFRQLWEEIRAWYPAITIDIDRVMWLIVGESADTDYLFKARVINGPFDADKLDYLPRDAHFTGIKAELDVERILYTIKLLDIASEPRTLVMKRGGVPHLEQIIFGKMMLYSSVYHHHKVRTFECMMRGVFELIWEDPSLISKDTLKFRRITDFLRVSEASFFVNGLEEPRIASQIKRILHRDDLQRILTMSSATMKREEGKPGSYIVLRGLADRVDAAAYIRRIREEIFYGLDPSDRTVVQDLWLDIPAIPSLSDDAEQCLVEMDAGSPPVNLRSFFPSDEWVAAYGENKWTAHAFYVPDEDVRRRAGEKAQQVLSEMFALVFTPQAVSNCFKVDE
jgi:uncharacterized protein